MEKKNVKIIAPIKYLCTFWRTLEMPLINCEIHCILTLSKNWFIVVGVDDGQVPAFAKTDTKLCVPVVILSTQGNPKLLQQLKPGFKRTIKISIKSNNTGLKLIFGLSTWCKFSGRK